MSQIEEMRAAATARNRRFCRERMVALEKFLKDHPGWFDTYDSHSAAARVFYAANIARAFPSADEVPARRDLHERIYPLLTLEALNRVIDGSCTARSQEILKEMRADYLHYHVENHGFVRGCLGR